MLRMTRRSHSERAPAQKVQVTFLRPLISNPFRIRESDLFLL